MGNYLPDQGMLYRPRLHALIHDGLRYPLLIMLAGPGYGKTQAMMSYTSKSDESTLWLRLTELDNLTTHFWDHVIQTLKPDYPALAKSLHSLGFPDTLASFDAFVRLFEKNRSPQNLIWVFDDFGVIKDVRILTFFRTLVDSSPNNFHIVLISNNMAHREALAFFSNQQRLILQKDLKFTQSEISELYMHHGVHLDAHELASIERQTEGWPLCIHLLAQQNHRTSDVLLNDENAISYLFEARFFSSYTEQQQKALLRLSFLRYFSNEIAAALFEGSASELDELTNHAFLAREPATGRLSLHYLYSRFLKSKQYLMSDDEKRQVWEVAAKHYLISGDVLEAIACYSNCENYGDMVDAMGEFVKAQNSIVDKSAYYFLEYLDVLSPEETLRYPLADFLRAWVYVTTVQLEKAETLLLDLEKRYTADGSKEALSMVGEVYILLGLVHAMRAQYDFGDYFGKAEERLPEGSRFLSTTGTSTLLNNHNFSMADNKPGAKEDMEAAAHYGMPKMARVLNNCDSGTEHIYSAEAAYLTYQLDDATEHSYRTIYSAQAGGLHDLVCNGHYVLAHIGLLQGSFQEMSKHVSAIVDHAEKCDIGTVNEIRDTAMAWYYLELQDYGKIPRSILEANYFDKPVMSYGRVEIVYANYLLHMKEYAKLVGMLEHPRGFFIADGIRYDRINLCILLAIGYNCLGNTDAAVEALWTAYDMCHDNKLITPFIEARQYIFSLLDIVKHQSIYQFDSAWCDQISELAAYSAAQTKAVRAAYRIQNPEASAKSNPLSKREREVLLALSQGLTREEISLRQYVSVNTVKSTIRNIYTKLNASNRAEAVSIAIAHGYIEG